VKHADKDRAFTVTQWNCNSDNAILQRKAFNYYYNNDMKLFVVNNLISLNGSGAHPASYSMGTEGGGVFPRG